MQNIIITLILTLSVFSIYENKAFAQQNDSDELIFSDSIVDNSIGIISGLISFHLSKIALSEKITDILNSVILTENIKKIDHETISFSVTYVNGDVFNVQCSVRYSVQPVSGTRTLLGVIQFLNCGNDEVVFEESQIVIPYRDINSRKSARTKKRWRI